MQHNSTSFLARFVTLIALGCLLVALLVGIGPNWSSRLMGIGGDLWDDYAKDLRLDPASPECELAELDTQLATCTTVSSAKAPDIGDPFADDEQDKEDVDPFADDTLDPFADEKPEAVNCDALKNMRDTCAKRHAEYTSISQKITPSVRAFRTIEGAISSIGSFPYTRHLLLLFLGLSALTTTITRLHISIRSPETRTELRVSEGTMLVAHLMLMASSIADIVIQSRANIEIEHPLLPYIMAIGFGGLALANLFNLKTVNLPADGPQNIPRLLMVIPLHAYMALLTAGYFLLVETHPSGQAIYVHKFAQHPNIYLGIGLYIWSGMLLANTRIATRLFDVITPWNLPPALLAWLVVVLAAYPTAYSGASGIFVIAAGAVIFTQMRAAGASSRLALTATAMSGSLGVVLNPCLVIVLIAILNKQVTTTELFGMGRWVFILTAALFLIAMLAHWGLNGFKRPKSNGLSVKERAQASGNALLSLLPYVGVTSLTFLGFWFFTDTLPNERTAPFVLPVALLALVAYDRWSEFKDNADTSTFSSRLMAATAETAHHSGALLMVMVASVGIGGLIERSGLMDMFPSSFGSPVTTMAILVIVMVVVGMTMDALGAVVLVSVSVATLAYDNGIDPIHFWMMVLVAFELGYLTPPVAINHLLARQVIGEEARVENDDTVGFFQRFEHILFPMVVMGTALILVAFVPFAWYP